MSLDPRVLVTPHPTAKKYRCSLTQEVEGGLRSLSRTRGCWYLWLIGFAAALPLSSRHLRLAIYGPVVEPTGAFVRLLQQAVNY